MSAADPFLSPQRFPADQPGPWRLRGVTWVSVRRRHDVTTHWRREMARENPQGQVYWSGVHFVDAMLPFCTVCMGQDLSLEDIHDDGDANEIRGIEFAIFRCEACGARF